MAIRKGEWAAKFPGSCECAKEEEERAAYGRRVVTWVVQDGGAQRVVRLRELMDFAGYTRVGNDASCNDLVDFFRTVANDRPRSK